MDAGAIPCGGHPVQRAPRFRRLNLEPLRRRLPGRYPLRVLLLALMLLESLVLPTRAAPPDLTTLDNKTLFERALLIQGDQGDCVWAIRAYQELLDRAAHQGLEAPIAAASLYNQGLCFERQALFDEALENFTRLLETYPDSSVVPDAWFRVGTLHELKGDFRRAERTFQRILKAFPELEAAERRGIQVQIGWQRLMQGRHRAALRTLSPVLEVWKAMPEEELRPEAFYRGKTHVALGILLSSHALEVDFKPRLGRGGLRYAAARLLGRDSAWLLEQRTEREQRIRAARAQYEQAMALPESIWRSAAYYRLGNDAEALYRDLNRAPVPGSLGAADISIYQQELQARTREAYLVTAAQLYLRGHERSVQSADRSAWAERLAKKVARIEAGGVDALGEPDPLELWRGDLGGREIRLKRPR